MVENVQAVENRQPKSGQSPNGVLADAANDVLLATAIGWPAYSAFAGLRSLPWANVVVLAAAWLVIAFFAGRAVFYLARYVYLIRHRDEVIQPPAVSTEPVKMTLLSKLVMGIMFVFTLFMCFLLCTSQCNRIGVEPFVVVLLIFSTGALLYSSIARQ